MQILDEMLASERWKHLAPLLDDGKREELVQFWHKLDGKDAFMYSHRHPCAIVNHRTGWPDSSKGLQGMKQKAVIGTLSNGNVRLLVDMVSYTYPWPRYAPG